MLTTRHAVDFPDPRPELEALFRYARAHDVEKGGRYDARSACLLLWSHHWLTPATRDESDTIGGFYMRWTDSPPL
jgi:hypothetical protein